MDCNLWGIGNTYKVFGGLKVFLDWLCSFLSKLSEKSWRVMSTTAIPLRKNWLQVKCCGNFLKGLGGKGAPHVLQFSRYESLKGR